MKIYNYDADTGEFLGEGVADADPMAGLNEEGEPNGWLYPAHSTTEPAPSPMPGNATVFRDGKWGYVKVSAGPDGEQTDDPHGPDAEDVAAERERRLELGFGYDFGDARGNHFIGTTKADMAGWDEVTKLANALIMSGQPDTKIAIMTGNGPVEVTAMEWQKVLIAAGAHRQPIFAASFALQYADPIPDDYKDDQYWPVNEAPPHITPAPGKDAPIPNIIVPVLPITGDPNNAPWTPTEEPEE